MQVQPAHAQQAAAGGRHHRHHRRTQLPGSLLRLGRRFRLRRSRRDGRRPGRNCRWHRASKRSGITNARCRSPTCATSTGAFSMAAERNRWPAPHYVHPQRVARVLEEAEDGEWLDDALVSETLRTGRVDFFSDLPAKTDKPQEARAREFTGTCDATHRRRTARGRAADALSGDEPARPGHLRETAPARRCRRASSYPPIRWPRPMRSRCMRSPTSTGSAI